MNTRARYQSLITAGHSHEHASEFATNWRSWPLLSRILTDARADNPAPLHPATSPNSSSFASSRLRVSPSSNPIPSHPTTMNPHLLHPATGPVATAITRCMDTYFPRHRPAFTHYQVTLLIDGHLTETTHIEARNPKEAFTRALDARRAAAIRAHRPDLTIRPHTILRLVA